MLGRRGLLKLSSSFKYDAQAVDRAMLLAQLDQQLVSLALPANTKVFISLASDVVRFMVLPASPIFMSTSEKQAFATAVFKETYGVLAAQWVISVDDNAPEQPSLACAMDASLNEALTQLMHKHHLKLVKLQPYVVAAFNRLLPKLAHGAQSILLVEPQRVVLLLCHHKVIHDIRSEKYVGDWQPAAKQMIVREQLRGEIAIEQVTIYASADCLIDLHFLDELQLKVVRMTSKEPFDHPEFAMLEALI